MGKFSVILNAVLLSSAIIFAVEFGGVAHADVDTIPPTAPPSLSASALPPSQIGLTWTASTDNVGLAGYYIYRNGALITSVNGNTFIDYGLSPGIYAYTVAAYDAAGNISPMSRQANVSLIPDTTAPSKPAGLAVTADSTSTLSVVSSTRITVSWNASTDNVSVAGYYVYRDGVQLTTSTLASTSYADRVPPGTYRYAVAAYDASQNLSDQSAPAQITIVFDNAPPSAPTNLSASIDRALPLAIDLSWTAASDNIGVAGYYVYRNGASIGSVASTSYVNSGLAPGNYLYAVAAYDAARNISNQSPSVSATVSTDVVGPSVPANLSVARVPSGLRLSWAPSSDNVAVKGYYVYRGGTKIGDVSSTPYLDSIASTSTVSYIVVAYDPTGNLSGESPPLNVIPSQVLLSTSAATSTVQAATSSAPAVVPPAPPVVAPPSSGTTTIFTAPLYFGLRNAQVKSMQSVLLKQGYLDPASATGFFGSITRQAVKKFQCDQKIVCAGGPASTGWGIVGAKTRKALNGLYK